MSFGKKLKKLRLDHGLTLEMLADMIGMGYSTISQYEREEREPSFQRLKIIKDFFNVDYNYLLDNNRKIKDIDLDIIDLVKILKTNYVTINGEKMNDKAREGLIRFSEYF